MNTKQKILVVSAIVFIFITALYKLTTYISPLEKENAELNLKITELLKNSENAIKSAEITETSNVEVSKAIAVNDVATNEIKKNVIDQIKKIENRYTEQPVTNELDKIKKELEIRRVQVNALWTSYCIKYPNDAECLNK